MLQKNVYILYPPGYGGSYLNWGINISDSDSYLTTVKNPLNLAASSKYGGSGTAHLHTRIPTHQGFSHHLNWMILNKPVDPRVYIINVHNNDHGKYSCITSIIQHDREGIIINIHDNNSFVERAFGIINAVTKWPTFLAAQQILSQITIHNTFDPFNCSDDILFRNYIVNNVPVCCNGPINYSMLNSLIKSNQDWYILRNKLQPHEVNTSYYIDKLDITNRVFEIGCADIASQVVPEFLTTVFEKSAISSRHNIDYLTKFHPTYINNQNNLQWFNSYAEWSITGRLDEFLLSHSIIQAQIIIDIATRATLPVNWEIMTLPEINATYQQLKSI